MWFGVLEDGSRGTSQQSHISSIFSVEFLALPHSDSQFAFKSLLESLDVKLEPTQTLLEEAKSLGMTGYGEMFSAQEMARLVEKYYSKALNGAAWSDRWDTASVKEILASMCRGLFFLVPYDVDKNHEPCCNGGKSAHWAALKGWVFPLYQQSQLDYALSLVPSHSCSQDLLNNVPFITFTPELRSLPKEQILLDRLIDFSKFGEAGMRDTHTSQDISPDYSENALRIIAQQSKSRHQAIWQFSKLRESNLNLKQFDFTRVIDSNFVVPDELEGLRGKIVLVSPATER